MNKHLYHFNTQFILKDGREGENETACCLNAKITPENYKDVMDFVKNEVKKSDDLISSVIVRTWVYVGEKEIK